MPVNENEYVVGWFTLSLINAGLARSKGMVVRLTVPWPTPRIAHRVFRPCETRQWILDETSVLPNLITAYSKHGGRMVDDVIP